jgi:hypothetical protein
VGFCVAVGVIGKVGVSVMGVNVIVLPRNPTSVDSEPAASPISWSIFGGIIQDAIVKMKSNNNNKDIRFIWFPQIFLIALIIPKLIFFGL